MGAPLFCAPETVLEPVEMVRLVSRSPACVAAKDREAWCELFRPDARIEDPVGSRPAVGHEEIRTFWDTFIAPSEIRFGVLADVAGGRFVFRDVVIATRFAGGAEVEVPAHLLYEVDAEPLPRIRALEAYWSLRAMAPRLASLGVGGLVAGARLATRMLRCGGPAWLLGHARAWWRALGAGSVRALEQLCADPAAFVEGPGAGATWKAAWLPAAGRTAIEARLRGAKPVSVALAARALSFRYSDADGGQGAGRLRFDSSGRRVVEVFLVA